MWSKPLAQRELSREQWLRDSDIAFKDVLGAGAQMARHSEETHESALGLLRLILNRDPVVPQASRQMVDEGKRLEQTNAGQALGKEFQDYVRATQEEIERLEAEHKRGQERLRTEQQKKIDAERRAREAAEERLRHLQRMREEEARRWERERAAAESQSDEGGCIVL
ncbi:hypothetical protein FS749_002633 [Ceratobasidium sp. UAMH 11750]|nr:hypothetical protein FS749_002633 [Ceratobasidium sp. UAMH 11750]